MANDDKNVKESRFAKLIWSLFVPNQRISIPYALYFLWRAALVVGAFVAVIVFIVELFDKLLQSESFETLRLSAAIEPARFMMVISTIAGALFYAAVPAVATRKKYSFLLINTPLGLGAALLFLSSEWGIDDKDTFFMFGSLSVAAIHGIISVYYGQLKRFGDGLPDRANE